MAKRQPSAGPFAAGVVVQGDWNSLTTTDNISFSRGTVISGSFYPTIDATQGTFVLWVTPEWDGNDGLNHRLLVWGEGAGAVLLNKTTLGYLRFGDYNNASYAEVGVTSWVAGSTYCVVARWSTTSSLDGTNYKCISINDVHTFGGTTGPVFTGAGSATLYIGTSHSAANHPANALIQGLTIYRRPLFDGTYGVDVGNGDEINLIYNAGTGTDPTKITSSWDVCLCIPTTATPGALTTGSSDAWSMPHVSNALQQWYAGDGYYGGGAWALGFNGTSTSVNCGSDAGIDDLHDGAFTAEAWIRPDAFTQNRYPVAKINAGFTSGWFLQINTSTGYVTAKVLCATTSNIAVSTVSATAKLWHHVAMTWDDAGDRIVRVFLDGIMYQAAQSTGGIVSDVSDTMYIGSLRGSSNYVDGAIGWVRISNSIRYTANFVPSRLPPAPDANTVAQWNMSEGTGTTLDNVGSISAAADGTITAGTWTPQWDDVGTPLTPVSVAFNGTSTAIDCGSEASIDNLHDAAFTVELWVRANADATARRIISKGSASEGWDIYVTTTSSLVVATVRCATTSAQATATLLNDRRWYHIAMTFDDAGTRKIRLFLDGVELVYITQTAGVGAVVSDAALSLLIGNLSGLDRKLSGAIGWVRISDSIRYTKNFTPPPRGICPADDANTVRLFPMNEGSGTDIADLSANNQHGTLANGTWNTVRDMATDAPGSRVYQWGYDFAGDAAGEGTEQTLSSLTPGADYVIRPVISYDSTAIPKIAILDATNDAEITSMTLPDQTANLVLNGGFDSDTGSWTVVQGTIASVAGGISGNCLELTNDTGVQCVASQSIQLAPYATYRFSFWHKNGTASNGIVRIGAVLYQSTLYLSGTINDAAWTQRTTTFTTTATGLAHIALYTNVTTTGATALYDSITLTRIIDSKRPWCESMALSLPTNAREGVANDCVAIKVQVTDTVGAGGCVYLHQLEAL